MEEGQLFVVHADKMIVQNQYTKSIYKINIRSMYKINIRLWVIGDRKVHATLPARLSPFFLRP